MMATNIVSGGAWQADSTLDQAVRACLRADCQTATLPIDVEVYHRIVFVRGVLPDAASVAESTAVMERAPDVADVIDQLDVDAQELPGTR
jgi:osmotically-inducible protein OsmY